METMPTVRVLELRPILNGNLKAFAAIQIGPLQMEGFRLIQQEGQKAYVSAPQQEFYDADGRRKYKPLLKYPEQWRRAIQAAILEAWEADNAL